MRVKKCKNWLVCSRAVPHWAALVTLALALFLARSARAQEAGKLTIAAAADLQFVLPEIVAEFRQQTGTEAAIIYGSSGNLYSQAQNGAPFDIFLSADMEYPRKLVAAKLADANTLYRYAVGRLVLWTPRGSGVDVSKGMAALLGPGVTRVAIANPGYAPYGRAAVEALKHAGIYAQVQAKMVTGENASQTEQFVVSGNAQVGLLPLAFAAGSPQANQGTYFVIPTDSYGAIDQGAVVLSRPRNRELAGRFLAFLKRAETAMMLKRYGFVVPVSLQRESR